MHEIRCGAAGSRVEVDGGAARFALRALRRAAALFCAMGLAACAAAPAASDQLSTRDGRRDFLLYGPHAQGAPVPLVLLLHGHIGTADNALGGGRVPSPLSAWRAIADREPLLVVALQGRRGSDGLTGWRDCRGDDASLPDVDDVAFANTLVQNLIRAGRVDARRIYVMGMSNGGMMTYRLALQMQPAPAAIAAVSASMAQHNACGPARTPVSVLLINGTADPIVPYDGGRVGVGRRKTSAVIGAPATRDFWLRADGLSGVPAQTYSLSHLDADDPTRVSAQIYGDNGGPQVEMVTIQNGGHVEPSLRYHYGWLYSRLVGRQNRDFESAERAWAFFKPKRSLAAPAKD